MAWEEGEQFETDYEDDGELYIDVEGEVIAETDKAWLVLLNPDSKVWLPKSRCHCEEGSFRVPLWLARKKGLD